MNHDKEQDDFWVAIDRLEGSAKNSHDHLKRLFLLSTQQKIAIEQLDQKVDEVKQEQVETRKDIARLEQKFDSRIDQQDKRIAGLEADNAEIKEMLKVLLSR